MNKRMTVDKIEYQCSTCKHSGQCWPKYPYATKCQDYKEEKEIK